MAERLPKQYKELADIKAKDWIVLCCASMNIQRASEASGTVSRVQ